MNRLKAWPLALQMTTHFRKGTIMPQNIYFKSEGHKERLLAAIQAIGKVWENGKIDPEYGAALYILCADLATWQRTSSYVTPSGIDFEAILEDEDFSGGYGVLISLAGNLFNDNVKVNAVDIPSRLDERNFTLALSAFIIRRHGLQVSDLQSEA